MLGNEHALFVIGDSDGLIALFYEGDALHEIAVSTVQRLMERNADIVFPSTAIAETLTALQRKFNQPTIAPRIQESIEQNLLIVDPVDRALVQSAFALYKPQGSKQNTFHDAIVAAMAKKLTADAVFSFDGWYSDIGLALAKDII